MWLGRVCVFCGSNVGVRPVYAEAARQMGELLARRRITLVYGAGNVGLMGVVADAALAAGGAVIGVIPEAMMGWEVAHNGLTELHVTRSMHERKGLMADFADAFVALPGGFGTFEEFCEIVTWAQLGLHQKPCGLLNVAGFYDPLLTLFDRAVGERFVRPAHRELVLEETDPERLLDRLQRYEPPTLERRIDRDET